MREKEETIRERASIIHADMKKEVNIPEATRIRASSLGELFDCPAKWQAKHLLNMRLPVSGAIRIGTAVHAGTALFDQCKLEGDPISPDDAAGAVVDVINSKDEEIDWEDSSPNEAEKIAVPLHKLYCEKIAPKQKYAAVEARCRDLVFTDLGIRLTGTVDRVRVTEDGLGVADIKTGSKAVSANGAIKTQDYAAQVAVYELLASQELGVPISAPAQIIGLQSAKTDKGRRAAIGEIHNARELLLGEEDKPGLLEIAANMVKSGNFYGNPKSCLCSPKYCPAYQICRWRK